MNKTKEKGKEHTATKRTTPRKRMEKKVLHQSTGRQGEGLSYESPWITSRYADGNVQDDQAQIEYAVAFDRQAELEYADEDPDRIRIAPTK